MTNHCPRCDLPITTQGMTRHLVACEKMPHPDVIRAEVEGGAVIAEMARRYGVTEYAIGRWAGHINPDRVSSDTRPACRRCTCRVEVIKGWCCFCRDEGRHLSADGQRAGAVV